MRLLILLLFLPIISFSQKNVENQSLIWYGYFQKLMLNEKWYIESEIQERHFIDPFAQHQFLFRTHLHRKLGSTGWEVSAGGCIFFNEPGEPEKRPRLSVPELRPHIEFGNRQVIKRIEIDQRYRTELRFFHNVNDAGDALERGYTLGNFRFRYRLQVAFPVYKSLKVKLSDEIHINAGNKIVKNTFDQNRLYGGLSYVASPSLTIDAGYMNFIQQTARGDYYNRNIARFTIFHTIQLNSHKNSNIKTK